MSTYPRLDESFDRLRQADWSVGEAGGATVWFVTGTNGETMIKAEGRTQAHRGSGQGFQGLQGECGHQPGTRHRYGIASIPALLIFKDGKIAARHVGVTPEATLRAEMQRLRQP